MNKKTTITIIGGGPRGLSALESLARKLVGSMHFPRLNILMVEASDQLGAGPVYNLGQPKTNWLNISERALTLSKRELIQGKGITIPPYPSYHEWNGQNAQNAIDIPDSFPARSKLGHYLRERFKSIADPLSDLDQLKIIQGEVIQIEKKEHGFVIIGRDNLKLFSDEVLLTIGHQPTTIDEDIRRWKQFLSEIKQGNLIEKPYPVTTFSDATVNLNRKRIAIRGFGLAMIDVLRALTILKGGKFSKSKNDANHLQYVKSGLEPLGIYPFSLDGLPPVPKPLNQEIDNWYKPTTQETLKFGEWLETFASSGKANDIVFIYEGILPIIKRIYFDLGEKTLYGFSNHIKLSTAALGWLKSEKFTHEALFPITEKPLTAIQAFIKMAQGNGRITLDYCIGQVWRHLQPTMYKALSFSNLSEEVIGEIIRFDERLKRYSYGPPVESLQQLLSLVKVKLVNLDFLSNPAIHVKVGKWHIATNNKVVEAEVMINSVLPSPQLLSVTSPIITNLLNDDLLKPIHGDLGIETRKNATVKCDVESEYNSLSVLGRLAKGSVIGADAILECFGPQPDFWADGVLERLEKRV